MRLDFETLTLGKPSDKETFTPLLACLLQWARESLPEGYIRGPFTLPLEQLAALEPRLPQALAIARQGFK